LQPNGWTEFSFCRHADLLIAPVDFIAHGLHFMNTEMQSDRQRTCFVIIPFAVEFKNQWELAIAPAIQDAGVMPVRGDDFSLAAGVIMSDVTRLIYQSDLIVADLSGRNPNVMYELGLAHAAQKPVIMIAQNDSDVPFDLSHVRYLKYDARDLRELRNNLTDRIKATLAIPSQNLPRFFPELEIMTPDDVATLRYLRQKSCVVTINVFPPTADVFFNDKLVGRTPQKLTINPDAPRNSISLFAIDFFEEHREIDQADIDAGSINIVLERRRYENLMERVPKWLRLRRQYPNNPVLMGAVLNFLMKSEKPEEALAEAKELLEVAAGWYGAWNNAGWVTYQKDVEQGKRCFRRVIALNPDHYIGYFNLACAHALCGELSESMANLKQIFGDQARLESLRYATTDLPSVLDDSDLVPLIAAPEFKSSIEDLRGQLKVLGELNPAQFP
jgi:tetratricopeptide (TPR) repeat protein